VQSYSLLFFEVVIAVTSPFFFLSNGSGNVVALKVTVAQHCLYVVFVLYWFAFIGFPNAYKNLFWPEWCIYKYTFFYIRRIL